MAVIVFGSLLTSGHAGIDTRVSVMLDTDSWYPLPEGQMKAAVMDAALDVLTEGGQLRLIDGTEVANAGELNGSLSLIGPADQVRFTLDFHGPGQPSFVATSSISIRGLGHDGIYEALSYLGGEVGRRLSDRLTIDNAPDESQEGNAQVAEALNRGKQLKREGRFDEARQAFLRVEMLADSSHQEWVDMAADELEYGLLVYEAQSLMSRMGDPATGLPEKRGMARLAGNRLREAVAQNNQHAERVREAQNWLDRVEMALSSIENTIQAQAASDSTGLRLMLQEHLAMTGECMGPERLEEMAANMPGARKLALRTARGSSEERTYELANPESGAEVTLLCADREINVAF